MVALASLTAAGPLAIDMYIPGFPAMATTLGVSTSAIQLTMTAFLAGIVIGQLLVGPISDGIGRRRLLLGGTLAFGLLSLLCAVAPTVEVLTVLRFLHGMCGAIGMVLSRAVLTDRFGGPRLPQMFALLSQIMGFAPVIAPVLGGLVLSVGSWRLVFATLAAFGLLQFLLVLILVPESLPPERRHGGGLGTSLRLMGGLLRQRSFVGYMLVLGANGAALFSYIAGSSFVFEGIYHVTESQYSLIFASNALGLVLAGQVFARLSRRILLNRLLIMAVSWCILVALAHLTLALIVGDRLPITWICLFLIMFGVGVIFPSVNTIAQMIGRDTPGSASALMGSTQFLCAAAASPLVGLLGHDRSAPMAMIMLLGFCAAGLALIVLARPWLGLGEVARAD